MLGHESITMDSRYINGILPKGPYPPCIGMADRALLAGYHRYHGQIKHNIEHNTKGRKFDFIQTMNSQKTSQSSTLRVSFGVYFLLFGYKIPQDMECVLYHVGTVSMVIMFRDVLEIPKSCAEPLIFHSERGLTFSWKTTVASSPGITSSSSRHACVCSSVRSRLLIRYTLTNCKIKKWKLCRDLSGHGVSQWEKSNVASHWLIPYPKMTISQNKTVHWQEKHIGNHYSETCM